MNCFIFWDVAVGKNLIFLIFNFQDSLDPFSLVADELSVLANRLRSMVVAEVSDFPISCFLEMVAFVSSGVS